jgi:hypothetical protein
VSKMKVNDFYALGAYHYHWAFTESKTFQVRTQFLSPLGPRMILISVLISATTSTVKINVCFMDYSTHTSVYVSLLIKA